MLILANIMKRIYSHPCNERQQCNTDRERGKNRFMWNTNVEFLLSLSD